MPSVSSRAFREASAGDRARAWFRARAPGGRRLQYIVIPKISDSNQLTKRVISHDASPESRLCWNKFGALVKRSSFPNLLLSVYLLLFCARTLPPYSTVYCYPQLGIVGKLEVGGIGHFRNGYSNQKILYGGQTYTLISN